MQRGPKITEVSVEPETIDYIQRFRDRRQLDGESIEKYIESLRDIRFEANRRGNHQIKNWRSKSFEESPAVT